MRESTVPCFDGGTAVKILFRDFCDWCDENKFAKLNSRNFGLRLGEAGIQQKHRRDGHYWVLRLVTAQDSLDSVEDYRDWHGRYGGTAAPVNDVNDP